MTVRFLAAQTPELAYVGEKASCRLHTFMSITQFCAEQITQRRMPPLTFLSHDTSHTLQVQSTLSPGI